MERYRSRLSGPLLDRIDALIEVPPLTLFSLENGRGGEGSAAVRERVVAARQFHAARLLRRGAGTRAGSLRAGGRPEPYSPALCLEEGARLSREARSLLRHALVSESLSGRAYAGIVKLARTIADLDQVTVVGAEHLAEALAFRLDYRRLGLG